MKKFFFAASILALTATAASAQSWTGVYVGGSAGYGSGSSAQTDPGVPQPLTPIVPIVQQLPPGPPLDGHYSTNGGMVGGDIGYNWKKGMWVFGVESDLSWTNIKGQSNVCGPNTITPHPCGTNLDALATFRGRAGIAVGPAANWLLYATAGVAVGDIYGWDALTPASGRDWRAGWAAGAGIETAIAPNVSAKLEYLHVDLGNGQVFNVVPGVAEAVSFRADTVRVGINYRFGVVPVLAEPPPPLYTKAVKAPALAVANPWAGWYAGLNAGYINGQTGVSSTAVATSVGTFPGNTAAMIASATQQQTTSGGSGFLGGAQVGYNFLLAPKVVAGWEADIQVSSLRGSAFGSSSVTTVGGFLNVNDTSVTGITSSRSLDYIGTIRARIGALATPNLLLYATGGLAYGGARSTTTVNQTFVTAFPIFPPPPVNISSGSIAATRAGYAVGAGGEWMFLTNWSAKLEYLYYDLGSAHYGTGISQVDAGLSLFNGTGIDAIATTAHVRFNGNIARAGVSYHFN